MKLLLNVICFCALQLDASDLPTKIEDINYTPM